MSEYLNANRNEVYLYHGTSLFSAGKIAQNGFNAAKFNSHNSIRGYGLLGRGTYLTDQLPKAALYAMCALCGEYRCACKTFDEKLIPKVTLLCKVALGNPEIIEKKDNKIIHDIKYKDDCHARVALSKKYNHASQYDSNEYAVMNDNAVFPVYAIYYHHIKNLLKPEIWIEQASNAKLNLQDEDLAYITTLVNEYHPSDDHYNALATLENLRQTIFKIQDKVETTSILLQMDSLIDFEIEKLNQKNLHYKL